MREIRYVRALVLLFGLGLTLVACGDEWDSYDALGPFVEDEPLGKADGVNVIGLVVNTDTRATQVWTARNAWEDTSTPAARAEGLAWPADSGLNWEEKYQRWIDSLKRVPSAGGWGGDTIVITNPQGKSLPAPKLECSETPMFLRVAFASFYGLPFFMTTIDANGTRVFFGHFGIRTKNGRYSKAPNFGWSYQDYSNLTPQQIAEQGWPQDSVLRSRALSGNDDDMDYVFTGARAGGYFDEMFLNKRVGYFLLLLLDSLGSMNLADARNAYNLKPEALHIGDFLLERWQKNGIGHTLQVKRVTAIPDDKLEAEVVAGSMPRIQPAWHDPVSTKSYFTSEQTGGEGESWDGIPYYKLGGGLKRWRVTKNITGVWTNTFMQADSSSWIDDTDYDALKMRPARFETLLGEVPPEEKRTALLQTIEEARQHLRQYPASCSARERRERAFDDLYALNESNFNIDRRQTDQQYRKKEDYVFAELVYGKSKTCCWDSSTAAMADIILAYADSVEKNATDCVPPPVFKATNGGYDAFKSYAASIGQEADWKTWSEDELCPQKNVTDDTEASHSWTSYCELFGSSPTQ